MNTKTNLVSSVKLVPSFADKCREMEKEINNKLLTLNVRQTSSTYLHRLVSTMQALHEVNKHH